MVLTILDLEKIDTHYFVRLKTETLCVMPYMVDVVRFLREEYQPLDMALFSDRIELKTVFPIKKKNLKDLPCNLH